MTSGRGEMDKGKSGLNLLAKLERIAVSHPVKAVRDAARRDADRFRRDAGMSRVGES